jgi:hypothetical protein
VNEPKRDQQPEPAFRQDFGRPRGLLVAPAVVTAAIALWVAVVQLGRITPPAEAPSVSPTGAAAGSPSSSARPSAPPAPLPPRLEVFGDYPLDPILLDQTALRELDPRTGLVGDPIGRTGTLDRMLALPDGGYVCVCVEEHRQGEERWYHVGWERFDDRGESLGEVVALGTWVGNDLPSLHEEPGPFTFDAAHSPDGRYLAVTTSLRKPPDWLRQVLLVDLAANEHIGTVDVPPGSVSRPAAPRWAWAPIPRFSPDGLTLLLSGIEVDEPEGQISVHNWVLSLDQGRPGALKELRPRDEPSDDACRDALPAFASDEVIYSLCFGDRFSGPFLRRDAVDGSPMRRVSLRDQLKDSPVPLPLSDGAGSVWLWDGWTTRLVRVDAHEGRVEAIDAMPDRGELGHVVGPPAVVLPGAETLVVAVWRGRETTSAIHVLDARTLERESSWFVDPQLSTIGASPDGRWLYLGHEPVTEPDGNVQQGRLEILDLETGVTVARFSQLGEQQFWLVPRSEQGR